MHFTISEAGANPASKSRSVGSDWVSVARATALCISDPRPTMDPTLSRSAARRVAWDAMEVANPVAPAAGVVIDMSGGAGKGAPGVRGVLHDIC